MDESQDSAEKSKGGPLNSEHFHSNLSSCQLPKYSVNAIQKRLNKENFKGNLLIYAPQTYTQTKRKSHTTSTKCQYHAAASKPKCLSGVK